MKQLLVALGLLSILNSTDINAGEIDGKAVFCKDTVYKKNVWEAIYFEGNHAINLVTQQKFRYTLEGHYVFWDEFRLDRRILQLTKVANHLKPNYIFYDSYLWCENSADVNTVIRKYNEAVEKYRKSFKL